MTRFEDFWYVVAESRQLKPNVALSRTVLNEWLVVFRGKDGQPVVLRDRCIHRNSRLSGGIVQEGNLHCPYHGWVYNQKGQVIVVPSEGENPKNLAQHCTQYYETQEQDGYVYVRLALNPIDKFHPFKMPHYGELNWETVRVINRFQNTLTNCIENFIDIPHTVSVHPGIFRKPCQQRLEMTVTRRQGSVIAEYQNESRNLGWYTKFLNSQKQEVRHIDQFLMPNVTNVEYDISKNRQLFITSQSIPETENSTLVYTDVTYNYGIWNKIARPFVHWTAQKIIRQDINILNIQKQVIDKYGTHFTHTPADTIHVFVESIFRALVQGKDPEELSEQSAQISFWV
ncbi:MAG: Rieske 2Fe-2S domain-containing protein [Microcoleaceae cyanobacterium]